MTHKPRLNKSGKGYRFLFAPALSHNLQFADKPMAAVPGADALILVNEWKAYRSPNWVALKAAMNAPVVFDGRNLYEPYILHDAAIEYFGIGRNTAVSLRNEGDLSQLSVIEVVD